MLCSVFFIGFGRGFKGAVWGLRGFNLIEGPYQIEWFLRYKVIGMGLGMTTVVVLTFPTSISRSQDGI